MNKLERMALEHAKKMADEIDKSMINLSSTTLEKDYVYNRERDFYPISRKAMELGWWIEAVLENSKEE